MLQVQDVIVISDLHLSSSEPGQGLFSADQELDQFLLSLFEQTRECMLVLNGDVLDFLFAQSNPGLDAKKLQQETDAIVQRHETVFRALSKWACSPQHQLVIIAGNHDPELAFPSVQTRLESCLARSGRHPYIKWLVHGEALALKVGNAQALIEHGDRLDPWNEIDRERLNSAISLGSRGLIEYHEYIPPLGSLLVTEHLVKLRKDFPWVELLKPEHEAVLPLLRYLASRKDKIDHAGVLNLYLMAEARSKFTQLRRRIDPAIRFRKDELEELSIGGKIKKIAHAIIDARGELKRGELIEQLQVAARLDNFFKESVPNREFAEDLIFLLKRDANILIHGHTHSAKAYRVGNGMYFNSGTWAQLLSLPDPNAGKPTWDKFLKNIEDNTYKTFVKPTYVRITLGNDGVTWAGLHEWVRDNNLGSWCYTKQWEERKKR